MNWCWLDTRLQEQLHGGNSPDEWTWTKSSNGSLTVKSVYRDIAAPNTGCGTDEVKAKIWKANLHVKLPFIYSFTAKQPEPYGNLALFEKVKMDIHKAIWHMRTRMQEHLRAVPESILTAPLARDVKWSSPPKGTIKINCDAAIGQDRAYVAIVARDWKGALVFALSKKWKPTSLSKPKLKQSIGQSSK
ncbi:hypothetical protein SO802_013573 [Lithocarpus litseifolius]|uniref:Uncharacterized protein n=1 Tax=Lithocarpus litseifolius TaxID=425828 RepID=A0AAW2D6J3_9ROSI